MKRLGIVKNTGKFYDTAMDPVQTLRDQLAKILEGRGAHADFDQAVANFPASLRGVRPQGAPHSAWDGYITGKNVELMPGKRIVQTWRTIHFAADDPDSTITVTFEPVTPGTRLTLTHRGVPDGQTSYEKHGWRDFYFEPMKAYFERSASGERNGG